MTMSRQFSLTMHAVKPKRDLLLLAFSIVTLLRTTSSAQLPLTKLNEHDILLQDVRHMPAFELQKQQQQQALVNTLPGLSSETIHRILRDENEPRNPLQEDALDLQLYESTHTLRRRSTAALPSAHVLQLSRRNLTQFNLERDFQGDRHLISELDLSWNNLQIVNLSSNAPLKIVNLSHNALSKLPTYLLADEQSALSVLNLNNNHIRTGAAARNFQLQELYLSGNEIEQLNALHLSNLSALETLDVSCNHITNVHGAFFPQRMHNLKHLNLANNQLSCIYRDSFYNMLSLNTMILSHNNISDIDYETFLALPNLQFLDLSHNQLRGESIRALQGIPDLMHLSIAYNPEVGAYMQEFVASWSLKQLDVSGTGLCKIPAALAQSVRTLKLSDNWLKVINCGDLDSYPLLQYLDLSYSRIEDIEDDALGRLEILEVLFLDHNKLTKVPISLPTSLTHLFLHNNQIMDIQLQAFQNLNNLQTLDLSSNQLLYLPALPLPKLLTLNLQSSGLKGVSQAIVHTLPRLRDLLLENNPIKCSDLLGIAEWASPCRLNERNEPTMELPNNNNYIVHSNVGQASPTTMTKIDLKQKYERLNKFFEKFQSTCSRQALRVSHQPDTRQPACSSSSNLAKESQSSNVGLEQHKTDKILRKMQLTAGIRTTTTLPTATLLAQMSELLQNDDANLVLEQNFEQRNSNSEFTTSKINATMLTSIIEATEAKNSTITKLSISTSQPTTETTQQIHITKSSVLNATTTTTTTAATEGSLAIEESESEKTNNKNLAHLNVEENEDKIVRLRLPKNIKYTKFDFNVMSSQQNSSINATKTTLAVATTTASSTSSSTLMETDILASQQTGKKLLPTSSSTTMEPTHKQHLPLQMHLKDRHLIGTPLLMHNGENVLVESDELRNTPKLYIHSSHTTTASIVNNLEISQRQAAVETKWPRDIMGIDKKPNAAELNINDTKLKHDLNTLKNKKEATLNMQKLLITHTKHHAVQLLDTNDYDAALDDNFIAETTLPPEQLTEQAVTPMHKHSTVNMPIHYKQPHQLHTFADVQQQQLQHHQLQEHKKHVSKDGKSEQWLDTRKPQTAGHPALVILISSMLFVTLLLGLLHVYRCDMPWRRHLPQPRPHQRQLNDDDDHSFLNFQQPQCDETSIVGYRKSYNSPLHNLHVHELQQHGSKNSSIAIASNSYVLPASASSSNNSSGSSSSSSGDSSPPHSHNSHTFEADTCYIEMAATAVPATSDLLPMELLSASARNCKSSEYSEMNTFVSRLKGSTNKLTTDSISSPSSKTTTITDLENFSNNEAQHRRTTKRTATTRKFDLW